MTPVHGKALVALFDAEDRADRAANYGIVQDGGIQTSRHFLLLIRKQ